MRIVRAFLLGLLVAVVGCGGNGGDEAGPTSSTSETTSITAAAPCGAEGVQAVTLTTGDAMEIDAALVGEGTLGVVLGHQFRSDFCSWVPFAQQLAQRHMRALAVNFVSTSLDSDMVAGARELLRRGAKRIILVGASMGGTAALVAATNIDVAGVVAVSAPREFSGLDALPAVRRLEIPVLFLPAAKTANSLETPDGCTGRRILKPRLLSWWPAPSTAPISSRIPKPGALSSPFSPGDRPLDPVTSGSA